jgi:uncharacterized protein (DUF1778 family)
MSSRSKSKGALKESKIQLRLRRGQKELIAEAARIKQTTMTSFMVEHAFSAAQEVLAEQRHFILPAKRWEEFCAALDRPARIVPGLRKLLKKKSVFDE